MLQLRVFLDNIYSFCCLAADLNLSTAPVCRSLGGALSFATVAAVVGLVRCPHINPELLGNYTEAKFYCTLFLNAAPVCVRWVCRKLLLTQRVA